MTVPGLFGYGLHGTPARSSTIPPSASDRGDGWHSSGSSGGSKGVSPAAMSALTLLVFLFFLNILQSCLQDMTFAQTQQPPIVMVSAPAGAVVPQSMREDMTTMGMASMGSVPAVMVPVATASARRAGRQRRGDPGRLYQAHWEVVPPKILKSTPKQPDRVLVPVPLVAPSHKAEDRIEEGDADVGADYEEEGAGDGDNNDVEMIPTVPPQPMRPQGVILVRPIVPLATSFRQFAWRAINAIARPLLPLLSLWRSGRDSGGASSERCCSMLMCELERIREGGGQFRTRLALILRGLTSWSCRVDTSLYHEKADCRALIVDCVQRSGRQTPFSTLASLLERFVP